MAEAPVIEMIARTALIPYARNSRTHTDAQIAQIAASIREFGFTVPILIDDSNRVIAGHARLLAAEKLKMNEVPCRRLSDLSEAQLRAYVIADNKLALNAGWDVELLTVELDDLREMGFDMKLVGFEPGELADLIGTPNVPPPDGASNKKECECPECGHVFTPD